jgi:hypothetical protein
LGDEGRAPPTITGPPCPGTEHLNSRTAEQSWPEMAAYRSARVLTADGPPAPAANMSAAPRRTGRDGGRKAACRMGESHGRERCGFAAAAAGWAAAARLRPAPRPVWYRPASRPT